MRVALQHVKKIVTARYEREIVFGGHQSVADKRDADVKDWNDVVFVMRPEEAEAILQALQVIQSTPSASLAGSVRHGNLLRYLEADIRKLTVREGHPFFEPSAVSAYWQLSLAARAGGSEG